MTENKARDLIQRLADAVNSLSAHLESDLPRPKVLSAYKTWKEARAYLDQPPSEES